MEPSSQNARLVERAYWLINLRWIAAIGVGVGTCFCSNILGITLQDFALYCVAILVVLYNALVLSALNRLTRAGATEPCAAIKKIINLQISTDLLILTVLLHFSGGLENPFVFFFIFHMIIASILLSVLESYLQATFAILLFGLLILLEYLQFLPHQCLQGFVAHCSYRDSLYVSGTFFVFAVTLYLVVYMAGYIATRLKRAEQAYIQANVLLREKDRVKDEYVLRVTHDIKGHLATVQSCLAVIVKGIIGPSDDKQADFINIAFKRSKKLTAFVKTLLKLTQMRLNGKLEMDVFSLSNTLHNAVDSVRTKAEDKSITLNCNIELSVDDILGNHFSIEEMVTNLLLNALKYTPEKGQITLNAKDQNGSVLLQIADTGIGIPQEEQPRVFDEFYRASNAGKVERDGTGLGLSIAKQIVEIHGGSIKVESKEGVGTTFSIILPKKR